MPQSMTQASAPSGGRSHGNNGRSGDTANRAAGGQARSSQSAGLRRSNASPVAQQSLQSSALTAPGGRTRGAAVRNSAGVSNASSGQGRVSRALSQPATVQQPNVSTASGGRLRRNNVSNGVATVQQSSALPVTSGRLQSVGQRTQSRMGYNQQYNRTNNYGGLWYAGNTHSDWSRDGEHSWNHHNYRWYDGGWLIIDGGYTPAYYSNTGSTVSDVQATLADQGYYHGSIDGDIGPGTRSAIANYQGDNDLRVTGRINDPLLRSLRLE